MLTIVYYLLAAICTICAMRFWQYDLGVVRLSAANILELVFIFFASLYLVGSHKKKIKDHFPRQFVVYNCYLFLLALASFLAVDWDSDYATGQYFKNLASRATDLAFIATASLVILRLKLDSSVRLVRIYVLIAVLSAIWCVAEVVLASSGFDLNKNTFALISTYREIEDVTFLYDWDSFYRASGFAGVNAQGTYLVSVVPLLLFWDPFKNRFFNTLGLLLALVGISLTMSRNAVLALVFASIFPLFFSRNYIDVLVRKIWVPVLAMTIYAMHSWNEVSDLFLTRFGAASDGISRLFSGRGEMYWATIEAVINRPLGYGLGQFVYYISDTDVIDLSYVTQALEMRASDVRVAFANLHNSWINCLFEFGFLGFFAFLAYHLWLLRSLLRFKSELAIPVASSVFGLMISGLFNSTLEQFSVQVFITVMTIVAFVKSENVKAHLIQGNQNIAKLNQSKMIDRAA